MLVVEVVKYVKGITGTTVMLFLHKLGVKTHIFPFYMNIVKKLYFI